MQSHSGGIANGKPNLHLSSIILHSSRFLPFTLIALQDPIGGRNSQRHLQSGYSATGNPGLQRFSVISHFFSILLGSAEHVPPRFCVIGEQPPKQKIPSIHFPLQYGLPGGQPHSPSTPARIARRNGKTRMESVLISSYVD